MALKRTDDNNDGKVLFIKKGGGSLRIRRGNKIVKPGERFWARPEEIPEAFSDTIVPVDKAALPAEERVDAVAPSYSLKHRGGGWFDIVDQQGKQINQRAMKKADAEQKIVELEA